MSLALQKGFSRPSSWAGLERTFRHSFCSSLTALATARDHEDRESALQKTSTNSGLAMKASTWAKFVNIMDFFVTETTRKPCKTTRSSPKMPIFLPNEQASSLSPLKRTWFVWNKMPVIGNGPLFHDRNSQHVSPVPWSWIIIHDHGTDLILLMTA